MDSQWNATHWADLSAGKQKHMGQLPVFLTHTVIISKLEPKVASWELNWELICDVCD